MVILNDEIWYFSLFGNSIGCLQSSLIWEFCNLPSTWITSDSSINGSRSDILQFWFNILESMSFRYISFNHLHIFWDFSNTLVSLMRFLVHESWFWLSVLLFLYLTFSFFLIFKFFTKSIISATILTIFDQAEAWFSKTDKTSICTTIWFTFRIFSN